MCKCSVVSVRLGLELFPLLLEERVERVPQCADNGSFPQVRQMERIPWKKVSGVLSPRFMVWIEEEVTVVLDTESSLPEVTLLLQPVKIKDQRSP